MDYHQKQLPLHCRVCGQRLVKRGKKEWYECKAFAADLHIAFTINTLTDNPQVHPATFLPLLSPFNAKGYQCQGRRRSAPQMCTDTVCMGSTYK